jgi:AcrR family transcriptional regulator
MRRLKEKATHPTKDALLSTALELFETTPLSEITTDLVLDRSGISKGSLYHHFEDLGDLLEQAQVQRFSGYVDSSIEYLTQVLTESKDRAEMLEKLKGVTRYTQSHNLSPQRANRVQAISTSIDSSRMRKYLAAEQMRMTNAIADIFREAQERGWANPHLDPESVAIMIQAYTMGRILKDLVSESPDAKQEENWVKMIDEFAEFVIFRVEK